MLNTKTIKIGESDVNIIQFGAMEAIAIRKELVEAIKKQLSSSGEELNAAAMISLVSAMIYEIPAELLLKLFKNCSAVGFGQLNNKENFDKVFTSNLDGAIELALEVMELNGFFSLNTISVICKKIPMLAPMEKVVLETFKNLKVN